MIIGIGHDVVQNIRIKKLLEQYEEKLIQKILSATEQEILLTKSNKINYIAKRFAAKEAFAKACGTGLRSPILMPSISIINNHLGKPRLIFNQAITDWLNANKITECHLSLSDEIDFSSAFVILETQ